MKLGEAIDRLSDHFAGQWGMVTAGQAAQAGVASVMLLRMQDAGAIEQVRRGVYALIGAPESPERPEQAVWLALAPRRVSWQREALDRDGGVASHQTAARLHQLGAFPASKITLTVPTRRTMRDPHVSLRQRALEADDVTTLNGLPITTIERTIIDLFDDHLDGSHIAEAIRDGYQTHHLDLGYLAAHIGRFNRRYGLRGRDGRYLLDHALSEIGTTTDLLANAPTSTVARPPERPNPPPRPPMG